MVKSPSCFKIITCGSDSAEKDDLEVTQGKGSSDKRGWSFRKRSARHRVLSNTVTTETPTFGNKEGSESAPVNFESQGDTTVPEKISVVHCNDEKPQLSTFLKPEVADPVVKEEVPDLVVKEEVPDTAVKTEEPDAVVKEEAPEVVAKEVPEILTAVENEHRTEAEIKESVVIVIQAAVRGFLARRELLKLKKLVKLQAAVRGHIVRRHAVGTLRCVQAIVKMQALVRARHARLSLEASYKNSDAKENEILFKKSIGLNNSTNKLLSNRFARQILEATPKTKPIHVKCDPSKPDSAWKWLERWMSVSSVNAAESNKVVAVTDAQEDEKNVKLDSLPETKIEPEIICESVDSKCSSVHESTVPSESEDNLIIYEAGKFDFQACHYASSSARENLDQPDIENTSTSEVRETPEDINALTNEDTKSLVDSQIQQESLDGEPEVEAEQPKRSMKRLAPEELETEGKRIAPSKFEELNSEVNSSYQEAEVQSVVIRTKEISIVDSPVHGLRNQVGGSECGTELSVTSTLDSPDRSDFGVIEHVPEAKAPEEEICDPDSTLEDSEDVPTEAESGLSLPTPIPDQQEKFDTVNGETVTPVVYVDAPKVELNPETPYVQKETKPEAYVQAHVPSPEASPRSHMTVPESQGTPSSQVSVKTDKKKSGKKRASLSAAIKKSPQKTENDSGSRSSVEKLPKEQKRAKRRNSFGSPKPENGEQEPRDTISSSNNNSNNNNSLPHFMQATESARAKLNANSSPRSSPDVHDGGDNYMVKKRHSLPGTNGRQGSPRIQRPTSQAQQQGTAAAKGNNERKWQR